MHLPFTVQLTFVTLNLLFTIIFDQTGATITSKVTRRMENINKVRVNILEVGRAR